MRVIKSNRWFFYIVFILVDPRHLTREISKNKIVKYCYMVIISLCSRTSIVHVLIFYLQILYMTNNIHTNLNKLVVIRHVNDVTIRVWVSIIIESTYPLTFDLRCYISFWGGILLDQLHRIHEHFVSSLERTLRDERNELPCDIYALLD